MSMLEIKDWVKAERVKCNNNRYRHRIRRLFDLKLVRIKYPKANLRPNYLARKRAITRLTCPTLERCRENRMEPCRSLTAKFHCAFVLAFRFQFHHLIAAVIRAYPTLDGYIEMNALLARVSRERSFEWLVRFYVCASMRVKSCN